MARGRPLQDDRADKNLHIRCLKDDQMKIQSGVRFIKECVSSLRKSGYSGDLPSRTSGSIICYALASYCEHMKSVLAQEKINAVNRKKVYSLLSKDPMMDASEICEATGLNRPFVLKCIRRFSGS